VGLDATIIAAMGAAVCVLDAQRRVVFHNPRLVALMGADVSALVTIDALVDPRDVPALDELLAAGQDATEPADVRLMRTDGEERWVSVTRSMLPEEEPARVLLTFHDVTERKQFERQAIDAEDRLTAFLDASSAVAWMKSNDGRHVYVNDAWRRVFQADPETIGDPAPRDSGALAWQTVRFPFWDASGNRYAAGIALDVTKERAAQAALRKAEEQLRLAQKMDALGRLAGGVAHDFNNLLTVIGGYAAHVARELGQEHPGSEAITEVLAATETATALTRQLLTFSRRQSSSPSSSDVNAVLSRSEGMLRQLIGGDGAVKLSLELAHESAAVLVDGTNVQQVIMNLVVNARDAMSHGGTITVRSANVPLDATHASGCDVRGAVVKLTVVDTGCGMDEATLARLYEPFFTTKTADKGTGLGLATVFGIVRHHGGCIHVESHVGSGTRFDVHLPRIEHASVAKRIA